MERKDKQFNMKNPAVKRILQEVKEMQRDPSKEYTSMPVEEDIFEWQFAIHGPRDSEFEGGIYHGRIILPADYPFKPPAFMLLTPSGRFEVQTKICLSISAHHPEHWQPSWSVRTALLALIAFMPTKPDGALGSLDYTKEERRALAQKSRLAAPKFGSPDRQNVINQIHETMMKSAPPIPEKLPPHTAPAPPSSQTSSASPSLAPPSPQQALPDLSSSPSPEAQPQSTTSSSTVPLPPSSSSVPLPPPSSSPLSQPSAPLPPCVSTSHVKHDSPIPADASFPIPPSSESSLSTSSAATQMKRDSKEVLAELGVSNAENLSNQQQHQQQQKKSASLLSARANDNISSSGPSSSSPPSFPQPANHESNAVSPISGTLPLVPPSASSSRPSSVASGSSARQVASRDSQPQQRSGSAKVASVQKPARSLEDLGLTVLAFALAIAIIGILVRKFLKVYGTSETAGLGEGSFLS
eukprot:TRINITY_DN1000_c0_g1_i1.p1 TRINITY_DN1000_c0_g1~~TRINITY_DN1000_c0_g1_i1.p1  ORF type:complete len:468 (+),score=114.87 TRINITY_DN1000_c0_g1_i1:400-1803(+)